MATFTKLYIPMRENPLFDNFAILRSVIRAIEELRRSRIPAGEKVSIKERMSRRTVATFDDTSLDDETGLFSLRFAIHAGEEIEQRSLSLWFNYRDSQQDPLRNSQHNLYVVLGDWGAHLDICAAIFRAVRERAAPSPAISVGDEDPRAYEP